MSYEFYKILHVLGALTLFISIGGIIVSSQAKEATISTRKTLGILHGVALLFLLVGGFGALARLDTGFGGWVTVKVLIWLVFGGLVALINRKPQMANGLVGLSILLGLVAIYMAILKPF